MEKKREGKGSSVLHFLSTSASYLRGWEGHGIVVTMETSMRRKAMLLGKAVQLPSQKEVELLIHCWVFRDETLYGKGDAMAKHGFYRNGSGDSNPRRSRSSASADRVPHCIVLL